MLWLPIYKTDASKNYTLLVTVCSLDLTLSIKGKPWPLPLCNNEYIFLNLWMSCRDELNGCVNFISLQKTGVYIYTSVAHLHGVDTSVEHKQCFMIRLDIALYYLRKPKLCYSNFLERAAVYSTTTVALGLLEFYYKLLLPCHCTRWNNSCEFPKFELLEFSSTTVRFLCAKHVVIWQGKKARNILGAYGSIFLTCTTLPSPLTLCRLFLLIRLRCLIQNNDCEIWKQ